ncbi:hypothetical protein P7K49_031219 [Saguinus oedipus]|uniref:Uncharacterized protein n=1 Tax=Saguinus oedipus TaxID=9490 RepID=A0ABQ9U576_SAGOE|nr:hypothetical protein P7K49_031219 [Saguinus oedipus]
MPDTGTLCPAAAPDGGRRPHAVFRAQGRSPPTATPSSLTSCRTLRDETAGCVEKASEKTLFTEATRVPFFNTPKKMTDRAKKGAGCRAGGRGTEGRSHGCGVAWRDTGVRLPRFKFNCVTLGAATALSIRVSVHRTRLQLNTWAELEAGAARMAAAVFTRIP